MTDKRDSYHHDMYSSSACFARTKSQLPINASAQLRKGLKMRDEDVAPPATQRTSKGVKSSTKQSERHIVMHCNQVRSTEGGNHVEALVLLVYNQRLYGKDVSVGRVFYGLLCLFQRESVGHNLLQRGDLARGDQANCLWPGVAL